MSDSSLSEMTIVLLMLIADADAFEGSNGQLPLLVLSAEQYYPPQSMSFFTQPMAMPFGNISWQQCSYGGQLSLIEYYTVHQPI